MRIATPPYIVNINRSQEATRTQAPAAAGQPAAATAIATAQKTVDVVSISAKTREIDRLKQELSALPDVRLDRVALAKQQMQQGAYRVDASVLAQKMLESASKG